VGEKEKARGFRLNSHLLPPLESEQREGGRRLGCGRPAAIPGEPGHDGGRAVGQNDEGLTGNPFPYLPWTVVARGGGFTGSSGLEAASLAAAVFRGQ
jgi:hypothetical protein